MTALIGALNFVVHKIGCFYPEESFSLSCSVCLLCKMEIRGLQPENTIKNE